ncbi:MAG: phosphatidylglycerophosphatase A [Gammaproteobacteria bacterium]|nr:phosphatidylglycerophosphatase A [Gammaproteobacteria bacterium]
MSNSPTFRDLLRRPSWLLLFGFGTGLSPKAPGTFGTLVAIPCFYLLSPLPLVWRAAVIALLFVGGVWLCDRYETATGRHDQGGIVWDEIVGYLLAVILSPFVWWEVIAAFLLFRLFDIWKPGPIGWLDRNTRGGFGVMIDDLAAGVAAALVLLLIRLTDWPIG